MLLRVAQAFEINLDKSSSFVLGNCAIRRIIKCTQPDYSNLMCRITGVLSRTQDAIKYIQEW